MTLRLTLRDVAVLCGRQSSFMVSSGPRDPDDPQEAKQDDWDVLFPSVSLHDWHVQMMRAAADSKAGLMREAWLFAPQRTEDR